jgi:hypothetical protein
MEFRWRALLVVACVLLAGCGGTGPTGVTPENPQTTFEPGETDSHTATGTPTKTLPEPLYRLELRNRDDGPVQTTVELTSVDNETTYYETETTLNADALRDYSSHVTDRGAFRATVTVAEESVSFVVGADQGYTVAVQNHTDIDVHHTRNASTTTD